MFNGLFKRASANLYKKDVAGLQSAQRIFGLTNVRFAPDPVPTRDTFTSGHAAAAWLSVPTDEECFIWATVSDDKYSWGEFQLWCSGECARARILEHRAHDASYPDSVFASGTAVTFKDEDGSTFTELGERVLPRELAINAIRAWLIDLKHPDFLSWS